MITDYQMAQLKAELAETQRSLAGATCAIEELTRTLREVAGELAVTVEKVAAVAARQEVTGA